MPANELHPYHETSDVTFTATAAVVGKRFVAPSNSRETAIGGNYRMAHCAAGAKPSGVATYDVASGAKGSQVGTPGRIVPVTAGGTIAAGAQVEVGADGKAIALASGIPAGQALTAATNGNDAEIKLS